MRSTFVSYIYNKGPIWIGLVIQKFKENTSYSDPSPEDIYFRDRIVHVQVGFSQKSVMNKIKKKIEKWV